MIAQVLVSLTFVAPETDLPHSLGGVAARLAGFLVAIIKIKAGSTRNGSLEILLSNCF